MELRPGESLEITVHGDPRYSADVEGPTVYRISTPLTGQDDGWGGNLLIELIASPNSPDLIAIGGDDKHIDFVDPDELHPQVNGKIIRIAEKQL